MRRIISCFLSFLFVINCFIYTPFVSTGTQSNALVEYDYDKAHEWMFSKHRVFMDTKGGGWDLLSADDSYGFNKHVDILNENNFFNLNMEAVHFLTDSSWSDIFTLSYSSEDVKIQYYVTALSSLLMTMEDNLDSIRITQAESTASKEWQSYLADIGKVTAGSLAQIAGNDTVWKTAFEICGISIETVGNSIDSLEKYEYLVFNSEKFISYYDLLNTLHNNSTDTHLVAASEHVMQSVKRCFEYRMDNFSEFCDTAIEAESNMFFIVLDNVITEASKDGASSNELTYLKTLNTVAQSIGSFKLGVGIGKLGGDIFIGSSNHILRYYEMCAMASARKTLINVIQTKDAAIQSVNDYNKIIEINRYLSALLYVNVRGAYCSYRIQSKDGGLLTGIETLINGNEIENWFDNIERFSKLTYDSITRILPNMDNFIITDHYFENYDLYMEYLLNVDFDEIKYWDRSFTKTQFCIIDLNDDGTYEMLVHLTNEEFLGLRGYESFSFLLTINGTNAETLITSYYGSGSGGGSNLYLKYDTENEKYVIVNEDNFRDGVWKAGLIRDIYSYTQNKLAVTDTTKCFSYSTSEDSTTLGNDYESEINSLREKTSLYKETEYNIIFYMVNGSYVSENDYNSFYDRFVDPTDEKYQMTMFSPDAVKNDTAAVSLPTYEDIAKAINDTSVFTWNWFYDNNNIDSSTYITENFKDMDWTLNYYRINHPKVNSIDDVKDLTRQYYTEDITNYLVSLKDWKKRNNSLYVSETYGIGDPLYSSARVKISQISATCFKITFTTYRYSNFEEVFQVEEFNYMLVDDHWVFDKQLSHVREIPIDIE